MAQLTILNKKERQKFFNYLSHYGISDFSFLDNFLILTKEKKKDHQPELRVYLINNSFSELDTTNLRLDSLGLYVGVLKNEEFRFSIEGSQLFGPHATSHVLELSGELLSSYLLGKSVELDNNNLKGFFIIKNNDDYFGSGKLKNNILINFYPKERRIGAIINDF